MENSLWLYSSFLTSYISEGWFPLSGHFAKKLFLNGTIFNFHVNNFGAIILKSNMALTTMLLIKKVVLLLKMLNQTEKMKETRNDFE